jgi:hypothetical protein
VNAIRQRNGRIVSVTDLALGPSGIGKPFVANSRSNGPNLRHSPFEWNRSIVRSFRRQRDVLAEPLHIE